MPETGAVTLLRRLDPWLRGNGPNARLKDRLEVVSHHASRVGVEVEQCPLAGYVSWRMRV
jgi:hypothetical protein